MRVLHVLPSLHQNHGGPLRLVLDLSSAAVERGLESEVVGIGALDVTDNPLEPELIHSLEATGSNQAYSYSKQLTPWLAENLARFSGVVIHGASTCLLYTSDAADE